MSATPHCTTHLPVEMKRNVTRRTLHGYGGHILKSRRVELRCPVAGCPVCAVAEEKDNVGKLRGTGRIFEREDFY